MTTEGNFGRVFYNGYEGTGDSTDIAYTHEYISNPTMPQNVGVAQFAPGPFKPALQVAGYRRGPQNLLSLHNTLSPPATISTDPPYVFTALLGNDASPVAGDMAIMMYGTLLDYSTQNKVEGVQGFSASMMARGLRAPLGNLMVDSQGVSGTIVSTPFDRGASASLGTSLGGVAHLHIYSPSGVAASGSVSLTGVPADADTHVINGVTYTYKTVPIAINQIKIGATAYATALNLYAALVGSKTQSGVGYFAGTTVIASTIRVAPPTAAAVIALTYTLTGVAGNAITLTKAGANLAVSGATLTGGVAGDTYTIIVASATTSGGAYTTLATFAANGTIATGERQEIAIGVLINEFIKVTATASGSTSTPPSFNVSFGAYYQL